MDRGDYIVEVREGLYLLISRGGYELASTRTYAWADNLRRERQRVERAIPITPDEDDAHRRESYHPDGWRPLSGIGRLK